MRVSVVGRFLDEEKRERKHGHGQGDDNIEEASPTRPRGQDVRSRQCRDGAEAESALSELAGY